MMIHKHMVQLYETDLMGIVHHSNYLRFFEEARVVWAHSRGLVDFQKKDSPGLIAVLETQVKHHKPALFGDLVEIEIQARMKGVRMFFQYKMFNSKLERELLCSGETVHVAMSPDLKSIKPPKEFKTIFEGEPWIETWL